MIATVFQWTGALLMLAAMGAALRAEGGRVDLSCVR
jgi:hypothetical protein